PGQAPDLRVPMWPRAGPHHAAAGRTRAARRRRPASGSRRGECDVAQRWGVGCWVLGIEYWVLGSLLSTPEIRNGPTSSEPQHPTPNSQHLKSLPSRDRKAPPSCRTDPGVGWVFARRRGREEGGLVMADKSKGVDGKKKRKKKPAELKETKQR